MVQNVIVFAIVAAAVIAAVVLLVRRVKRPGSCNCGCGGSGCKSCQGNREKRE